MKSLEWIPAQNLEAEQAVLGALILDNDTFYAVDAILPEQAFWTQAHNLIYSVIQELRDEDEPIDILPITARLQDKKQLEDIGGVAYLSQLAHGVPVASNAEYYARIVRKCYQQRMGYQLAKDLLVAAAQHIDPAQLAAQMEQAGAFMVDQTAKGQDFKPMREVVMETYDSLEQKALTQDQSGVTGIPSGYDDLDKMTSGFQRSDLIIIAARPSVGKTALVMNMGRNGAKAGHNIAVFSLEMSAEQLGQRFLSAESNLDGTRIRTGKLAFDDWDKLTLAMGSLSEAQIYVDDTPGISVSEIRAKCRRLKKKLGSLGMIIIDYLQLLTLAGKRRENRQQEVSEISRTLKRLAKELDVPVIALSQLSRAVEQRQDKRPMMSDLRESGSIEQDADVVAFLYRDDYYDKETEKKNIIEINIAKQRNGPVGLVELAFLKQYSKFVTLDRGHQEAAAAKEKLIPDMYRGV